MALRAVVLDVGETLVDETELMGTWADRLGVPRLTFFACLGAVIERGEGHRRVFEILDVDMRELRERWGPVVFGAEDLYPDATPCIAELDRRGYVVGIAGNQPERAEEVLGSLELPVAFVASSARWGVQKPSPDFFARIVAELGLEAGEVAYIGDRLDNDVLPARDAGMVAVFCRRGPWGYVHALRPEADRAHLRVDSLAELPEALATWSG